MEKKPISRAGFDALIKELKDLQENQRPEILKTVQWARSLGDLSENADYSAAKEKQRQIDARIRFIENVIENKNLEIKRYNDYKYCYSNIYNKIMLSKKLDRLIKFNEKDENLLLTSKAIFEGKIGVAKGKNKTEYSEIVKNTGASTATISRVNKCLVYGCDGYTAALSKMAEKEKNND